MAKVRIHALVILLLLVAAGAIIYTWRPLEGRSYQDSYTQAGATYAEALPSNSHITGYIEARYPFSVYVVNSDSGYFEGINGSDVVMSWENVTEVDLNFTTSNGTQYLVIKNGNVSQRIGVVINSKR
ncbi:hypothetical protein A3L11_04065 [Thermococcus siculi]|uniref:Multidrug transporter n=1 Tax=Thermococcus siculi TaxID=72803 RepID=A0A2Z2MX12_9EURY|nr:multidrug transporter [Thermococcus siculi]ASJ08450.1 hypothetical protein A3L11_04065 [Thermococcus siculi]